ncbi:aromatic hydrocarbon degradation protein [Pseudodesulfovibrio cashew]|uniref:Aromatic hydrocarbon degradation protein n=1 Tax=Pseudodesulfovibrio cashew TaxID=2678688 RepID=A0A6I6JCQ6_9BACT|nr:outer membrane protein transport protein [Pseudodesulfovibrio cashew]QGY40595.1 aromatic hydrocarbon degradation protein [Pseudodesulfovibrio cashew]
MKRASIFFFCALFLSLTATAAYAGGFALYEWSSRGVAMGTTGYAFAGDASVVATNPALMTKLEGGHVLGGFTLISPQSTVVVDGDKNKTKANIHVVPHAYYTQQMGSNEDVWLGFGLFTRYGLGTEYDHDWIGKGSLQQVLLESISFNPNIAFKLTDNLSLAVGVEVLKGGIKIKRNINILGTDYQIDADTEGYAFGGNLALHYDVNDQWALGLTYRAPMKMYTSGSAWNQRSGASTQDDQDIHATLPGSYTFAVGYQPMDEWTWEFDVVHTRWEHTDKMVYEGAVLNSETPLHYKNTWRFQLGTEYWLKQWLALRFGYIYDQTPTRAGDASFMLPANDRQLYSTGLGFKWDKWTADWSFMYVSAKSRHDLGIDDPNVPGGADWDVDFKDGKTWVTGVSLGYSF